MSRRQYNNNRQQQDWNNNNNNKTQKKFVPKNQNPNPTLSNSLRQSFSKQSDAPAPSFSTVSGGSGASSSSRIQLGNNGEWVSSRAAAGVQDGGNFVNYLPQDEAVAAGLGAEEGGLDALESQRVVDLLNRELSRLLKLSPREFWREVATDNSLHEFLDSFLKFRSRWYDFPHHGAKEILAGVIVGELELIRRVFMILYRISSSRDPGAQAANSLSSRDHTALLQEKKLLNLPKLLDICAIYGLENEDLTHLLVTNALTAQPGIHDNLTVVVSQFLGIVHTMHQRCISSLEALLSSGSHEDNRSNLLHTDFLEVMDFINDAIVSMDAFITAYKPSAIFFSCSVQISYGNEELLITLARLHDTLLPSLERGFQTILAKEDDGMVSSIIVSLKMLSMRMVKLGWNLIDLCYLSGEAFEDCPHIPAVTKMFPAKVEDPSIRAEILIQLFREMSGFSLYAQENQKGDTFLKSLDKSHHIASKLQSLLDAGWIFMDDEQLQYLSGIMMFSLKGTAKNPTVASTFVQSNRVQMHEDAAIMESKIHQIKDLFPECGKGFLAACLEVYNQNPEEVIQRILEGTLHEDLQLLDTSMEAMPLPKSASTVSTRDKGKGKLVESAVLTSTAHSPGYPAVNQEQQMEGPTVSSLAAVGRFVRKSNDMPDHYTALDTRDDKDAARTMALISQYQYEDEYDDSFDDLGFSVAESGLEENEILSERISSNTGKQSGTEGENSTRSASDGKWGSRRKPQYYVKDGKNYSYKVAGSVEVANYQEAALVTQAQGELIHGLGRGGNIPLGAVRKLIDQQEQEMQLDENNIEERGIMRNPRGRGRRGGGGRLEEQDNQSEGSEVNAGNPRGRGRRGGRGSSNYRKDRAMKKHFTGLSSF